MYLGMGPAVEVMKPEGLRQRMAEAARGMMGLYKNK